tara:strand:+ start:338 stop:757 length:420 start_codon:yes stop_codon:yes gene_type:complete
MTTVEESNVVSLEGSNVESLEGNLEIKSTISNVYNWIMEHKVFIFGWGTLIVGTIIYFTFIRKVEDSDEVDNTLLAKGTDELMNDLELNVSKNIRGEHLTESEQESDVEEDDNLDDMKIDTLSNDLDKLEGYAQESTDI